PEYCKLNSEVLIKFFFFSSRRRHTRFSRDWSSDVCSSDLCIARFEDNRTTGAPVLMLMGRGDQIIDIDRCGEVAADLREGGSEVEMIVYQDAYHMWDGGPVQAWRPPHHLADCKLVVQRDGSVYDENTWLPMN